MIRYSWNNADFRTTPAWICLFAFRTNRKYRQFSNVADGKDSESEREYDLLHRATPGLGLVRHLLRRRTSSVLDAAGASVPAAWLNQVFDRARGAVGTCSVVEAPGE